MKFFKMKFWLILGIGVVAFIFLPFAIDQLIMNKFVTTWNLGEWAGFLGSYLGSGIGALITLGGVWWQVKREDKIKQKDKKIGVLKGVLYSLNRNLETENKGILCKQSFYIFDYYYMKTTTSKFYNNFIYSIFPEIIKENYKTIFELDFGKEIIDLDEMTKKFNQNYKFLILESKNKSRIMKKIEQQAIELKKSGYDSTFQYLEETKKSFKNFYEIGKEEKEILEEEILELGKELHKNLNNLILSLEIDIGEEIFEEDITFLTQCMLAEDVLLNKEENIFKIMGKIQKLKEKIEDEIKKLENQ